MKNFKLFACVAIMSVGQVYTVDIPKTLEWCGNKAVRFGDSLLHDTTTQVVSVSTVVASVVAYQYVDNEAASVCLDQHPNSKIMHKARLIYMPYSDFVKTIADLTSYAEVVEFMNTYCIDWSYAMSDVKINRFIALVNDLQRNNALRVDGAAELENQALELFKDNLILAQENIKEELINGAINANKNANNAFTLKAGLEIVSAVLRAFNNR